MKRVAVVGTGQTVYKTKRLDVNAADLVFEASRAALDDCGLEINDIDAVVFASAPEAFEGVHSPDLWCADASAALGKPMMRIHTGGSTGGAGAIAGMQHVASGMFDVVLVVAVQRIGESPDAQKILNTIWDPIYEKDFALNIINICAQMATRQMYKYGLTEEQMALVSVKNHLNAINNPYAHLKLRITVEDVLNSRVLCWPIKLLDACPRSDGACAVVLASEEKADKIAATPAWILGASSSSDTYGIGERFLDDEYDFADIGAIPRSAKEAYKMAGIDDPMNQIDVAELYTPFSSLEIVMYEGLGFCEKGEGGRLIEKGVTEMDGQLPVNPSGGTQASNPIGATGLVRVADAALQVMEKAGKTQVDGVKTAIATAVGGSAQFVTTIILGKDKA
ncbi:MAG: thiolase family protein [Thermodesulfobacteriota bacterium]|nr:thiolase family protein [Thermodesulfobacteriota bacterium]